MGNLSFLTSYVQSCTSGKLGVADCSVVWQLGIIVLLLVLAVSALIALRLHSRFHTPAC